MYVIIVYDVGVERVQRVCKYLKRFLPRVQNSVFECKVDPAQWTRLKHRLLSEYLPEEDSLRFYYLGSNWKGSVEHHGAKEVRDVDDPLIV